ncbi:MAG TPA: DUF2171 domain-containing protein [Sphingomicrobium sp.]
MAYDRHDTRHDPRDERRWRDERFEGRDRGEDRGFFERAGDEIASWFGDDDAEGRRRQDQRMEGRDRGWDRGRDSRRTEERGRFSARDRDFDRGRLDRDRDFDRDEERGGFFGDREDYRYRRGGGFGSPGSERRSEPMFGGYTAAESLGDAEGYSRRRRGPWGEDSRGGDFATTRDPHYHAWRQRQLDDLDRDYDDYRRENQARFESDFGSWREQRMRKRGLLGQIREHMEVVGNDDAHVGTVDRVAGDRLILAKSDPDSGGAHHSLSCADLDRVEGDRIILDCSAEQAKQRWRDESRSRALFEREDQGEMGDRALNRSFEGTYRER